MDEKSLRRRNWVKNIAIVFLAIMLILTLFSNTIMNYSLPEVAAQYCYGGSITTRIRGNATIEAKDSYSVTLPSSMASAKVKAVGVKNGTFVTTDTVLFTLEDTQQHDLIEAIEVLASLKEEYNNLLSNSNGGSGDITFQIAEKKAEIEEAKNKRNNADIARKQLESMNEELRNAQKQYQKDQARLEKVISYIDTLNAILDENDELAVSQAEIRTELESKSLMIDNIKIAVKESEEASETAHAAVLTASEALEKFESENSAISSITEESLKNQRKAYASMQLQYDELHNKYLAVSEDIIRYKKALENASQAVNDALERLENAPEEEKEALTVIYHTRLQELENARTQYEADKAQADDTMLSYWYDLQNLKLELKYAREDLEKNENLYNNQSTYATHLEKLRKNLKQAENTKNEIEKTLEKLRNELSIVESEYNTIKNISKVMDKSESDSLTALYDEQAALEAAIEHYNEYYNTSYSDFRIRMTELEIEASDSVSDSAIREMENSLAKLEKQQEDQTSQNETQNEIITLRLDAKEKEISEQEALIEKIKTGDYTTVILSPVEGVVSSVNVYAGSEVHLNSTLVEIQIVDKGYTMTYSVSSEQAKRIKIGSDANITNYWGSDINAKVVSITVDPDEPTSRRIVRFDITGNVDVGTNLSFTIGEKSQNYETIVPNTAIREDNNGKFVLVVDAKATPLSTRYTARRVDITVVASDETSSAVNGISYGDYVVTSSSKPIVPGMQVRLNEN